MDSLIPGLGTMSFYWIYDLPTWQFGLGTIALFTLISVGGLSLTRTRIYNKFRISDGSNETVNGFFAGVGVIYGLLVGLVAVAAWDNYQSVDSIASKESASIAALYRDISTLEQPSKGKLQAQLRDYLDFVIQVAWPAHKRGERPRYGGGCYPTSIRCLQATTLEVWNSKPFKPKH